MELIVTVVDPDRAITSIQFAKAHSVADATRNMRTIFGGASAKPGLPSPLISADRIGLKCTGMDCIWVRVDAEWRLDLRYTWHRTIVGTFDNSTSGSTPSVEVGGRGLAGAHVSHLVPYGDGHTIQWRGKSYLGKRVPLLILVLNSRLPGWGRAGTQHTSDMCLS